MDIQTRKLNIIAYLAQLQDESLIQKIEKYIINSSEKIKSADKKPMTIQELLDRIEKSEMDFKEGRVYSQDELENLSATW
jgi:hypothetical protein